MLEISRPIIVEGKYDKIKLSQIVKAHIVTTDGFGIFSKSQKTALIRRLAENGGVIVLTDSDGAGLVIRNYLRNLLPPDKIIHLYTPRVKGKEKRKSEPSKEGILGVEGMELAWLEKALAPFADGGARPRMKLRPTISGATSTSSTAASPLYMTGTSAAESTAAKASLSVDPSYICKAVRACTVRTASG